jgi:hypothetical protein
VSGMSEAVEALIFSSTLLAWMAAGGARLEAD